MRLEPFQLERYFSLYEFSAPYILGASDAETWEVEELLDLEPGARQGFLSQTLGYAESQGAAFLRQEIARSMSGTAEAEQVLVCGGAEEAVFIFMNALLNPGDHLIVHSPCFQPLAQIAHDSGCQVAAWEGREDNGWRLDLDWLKDNIRQRTRAIVVNLPHNPTGYLMGEAEYRELIELVRSRGLILFSDEVYRLTEYNPADRLPPASDLYEKAVSLGSMSKAFGLAGLRIGWVTTQDPEICRQLLCFRDYTSICSNGPGQFLAALALRQKDVILKRNREIIAAGLASWRRFFDEFHDSFQWVEPRAGTTAFPRARPGTDVDAWCRDLVEKTGVMLCPGSVFGRPHHFRIGLGYRSMPRAVGLVGDYLRQGGLDRFFKPSVKITGART